MSVTTMMSMPSPSTVQSCVHETTNSLPHNNNKVENEQQEICQNNNSPTMLTKLEEEYGNELFTIAETK